MDELTRLTQQIETHENLIANLLLGFTDLSVAVETLTEKVMEPIEESERAEFRRRYDQTRNEMLKMLKGATQPGSTV